MIIDRFPVVIFSPPRTGSLYFTYHLKNNNPDIRVFLEPTESQDIKEFLDFANTSSRFVVKIISSHFWRYTQEMQDYLILDQNFKIKLTRKDIIKQIASSYIAYNRNVWAYKTCNDNLKKIPIIINKQELNKIIMEILKYNRAMKHIPFDVEVFYEDIAYGPSPLYPTPLPVNYDELLSEISKRLR
jgi:hypothetical protein